MSTGENINANGSALTEFLIRTGFRLFPQSEKVLVGPALWPQIPLIQSTRDYPFKANYDFGVPPGQAWFIGTTGDLLGRIVNIGT